jgi:ketosteroid isomerase-like protein
MTFAQTIEKHLGAIRDRNLPSLLETLPDEDDVLLIMSDGRMVRSVREFVELHRDWFASSTWKLDAEPVHTIETPDLGIAVLYLNYRDNPSEGKPIQESSLLTLVFARRGQRWVMVQDQNTPIKAGRG